jgi:anti-sigma factor RsiW
METHIPLEILHAYRRDQAKADDPVKIEQHLAGCAHCAENMTLLEQFPHSRPPESPVTAHQKLEEEKNNCPTSETIAYYVAGALPKIKQWRFTKHLAECDRCRWQLLAISRASTDPISDEEKTALAALPPFTISEQVEAIKKLKSHETTPVTVIPELKRWLGLFILNPRPAFALAVILFLGILAGIKWGWPAFQYDRLVSQSEAQLEEQYKIYYREMPRPSLGYLSSDIAEAMGPEEEKQTIEARLKQALQYKPNGETARLRLAQYFLFQAMEGSADSLLKLLEAASPPNAAVLNDRGIWFFQQQQFSAAANAFQRALELNPRLDEALYNLAIAQKQLGNTTVAKQSWEQYLKQDNIKPEWRNAAKAQLQELEEEK